jgi:hypothetical protein
MSFLTGKPTKAFIFQDHDAHIAVHQSMMQDPVIMGQLGQNPMAQQMQAAIMAHTAEHLAFQYRQKIQEQLGATLPPPDAQLDEQTEVQVSKLVAQAAAQLLAMDKAKVAQQQAMAQAQDPVMQMQQAELAIKKKEAEIKELKVKGDLQLKAEELSLKAQESAAKTGEDPAMASMRLQQEIMQAQELHGMEMAAKRMELEQAQAQQQQAMQQQQAQAQQKMAHGVMMAMEGSGMLASLVGPDNADKAREILLNIAKTAEWMRITLPRDYDSNVGPMLANLNATVAAFKGDYENWRKPIGTSITDAASLLNRTDRMLQENEPRINRLMDDTLATLANARSITGEFKDKSMPAAMTWLPKIAARSTSGMARGIWGASSSTNWRFLGLALTFFSVARPAGTAGSRVSRP